MIISKAQKLIFRAIFIGKAFARRDKLVIHMNKLRHRPGATPISTSGGSQNSDQQQQSHHSQQPQQQQPQQQARQEVAMKPKEEPITWPCEVCGRTMATREEWINHARFVLKTRKKKIGKQISFDSIVFADRIWKHRSYLNTQLCTFQIHRLTINTTPPRDTFAAFVAQTLPTKRNSRSTCARTRLTSRLAMQPPPNS